MIILITEHLANEGSGRIGSSLLARGIKLDVRRTWNGDTLPDDLSEYGGVIAMGGPMNTHEVSEYSWMRREMEILREMHEKERPVVGVCLGCQMLAVALGGEVGPMEGGREIGWHEMRMAFPGTVEAVYAGMPWKQMQFHWHSYEVKKLPSGAVPLAFSEQCKIQAFKAGLRSYGFQYHFEVMEDQIHDFSQIGAKERLAAGIDHGALMAETKRNYADFARLGDRLCGLLLEDLF